jgi:hypothetical protein
MHTSRSCWSRSAMGCGSLLIGSAVIEPTFPISRSQPGRAGMVAFRCYSTSMSTDRPVETSHHTCTHRMHLQDPHGRFREKQLHGLMTGSAPRKTTSPLTIPPEIQSLPSPRTETGNEALSRPGHSSTAKASSPRRSNLELPFYPGGQKKSLRDSFRNQIH